MDTGFLDGYLLTLDQPENLSFVKPCTDEGLDGECELMGRMGSSRSKDTSSEVCGAMLRVWMGAMKPTTPEDF